MTKNYKEYMEAVKNKLDAMNKAAGVDPQAIKNQAREIQNQSMPSNEIFDMLGKGAMNWLEKNKNRNQ
jgi:hypothetical protein